MKRIKLLSIALILSMSVSLFGCSENKEDEETTVVITTAETPAEETTTTESEWQMPDIEVKADPITDINEIFEGAEDGAYVPFQDNERSFCWNQEGYASPILYQNTGSCDVFALSTVLAVNYQIYNNGELPYFDPIEILQRFYCSKEGETTEGAYIVGGNVEDYGSLDGLGVIVALSCEPYDGYLLEEYNYSYKLDGSEYTVDELKELIKHYGPIEVPFSASTDKAYKGMYTESKSASRDHWVTIVGWDDDFPAENYFQTTPSTNGAWLIQNSGSKSWGNNGYAWVTYDYPVGVVITAEATKEYSYGISNGNFYACDVSSKYSDETCAATVFENEGSLKGIGIYTTTTANANNTLTIEIYDGEFGELLATIEDISGGYGYHVYQLPEPLEVSKFTVVEKINGGPIAFEGSSFSYESEGLRYDGNAWTTGKYGFNLSVEEGRSFLMTEDGWVDVTAPDLNKEFNMIFPSIATEKNPGDPSIVALFE